MTKPPRFVDLTHPDHVYTSLFILHHGSHGSYILVYVDDILVTNSDQSYVATLLQQLSEEFSIKDLGNLHFFLGIDALKHSKGILLSQYRYIKDLLHRASMTDCKSVSTPLAIITKPIDQGGDPMSNPTEYRSIVGALQYVTLTHSDVSLVVNKACQFMHAPTIDHWQLVKHVLKSKRHKHPWFVV
ncbi:uncharacterized mitochondrial protein AtMg00810-like [Telopea speciosissima]|uniref:uncharacterized mitochondrial protein AtMg00810-like n=1 Tax=Telopea speciosissima TaxID=54955 RepID=UPI001CC705B6|nr:uncharacterized mitochondrial protein AtMg00810-like [Telopea speciosissima]